MKFTRRDSATFFASTLLMGIITDILFRQAIFGINFIVMAVLWAFIMLFATVKKKDIKPQFLVFSAFAILNAFLVYFRIEEAVQIWSVIITLVSLALMAGMVYADNFMQLTIINRFTDFLTGMTSTVRTNAKHIAGIFHNKDKVAKRIQVSNGVVVAIIFGLIFIGLFSSSDTVFQGQFRFLGNAFKSIADWLSQFNIGRIISIIFWACISGVILLVLIGRESPIKPTAMTVKKFYTNKDSIIILTTLCAIFSFFILIQVRYLFAGSSLPDSLSYADYARRGYGELLLATMLASAVIYSTLAHVKDEIHAKYTKIFANFLVILNSIVVVSAWKRLSLYESAYGWTMTRFVARLGLICILLGSGLLLTWVNKRITAKQLFGYSWYAVATVLTIAALLNPVGIITHKNIAERSSREVMLDIEFMRQLSPDSYPAVCKYAPTLKAQHPKEYKELKSFNHDISNAYTEPHETNHGLSGHYTFTKHFKQSYYNCLE